MLAIHRVGPQSMRAMTRIRTLNFGRLGSLGSSCSQDDTSSDQRTDIDLIDGLDLNVAPSPLPFTRGVGSLASPRSNGTVNQGASLLAGAGAIHHMLSGHRSNAMASRTDGISAAHMSPGPLVPIIVRQGECLDLHEKHKQTKIIYKIKGLHGDEESDTDIPEAQGCVEDRESPPESSSASTSGRSGLFIEMVSSSLLHPNQSYAPLGTEDPGSSGSEVELLRFDVSYSIQRSLATDLQSLSMDICKKQFTYLERIRQQKEGQDGVDLAIKGFSEHQMAKLKINKALTEEREREIQQVAQPANDLAQIMKDLMTLVIEQGTIVDRIEYNKIQNVATTVDEGLKQLQKQLGFEGRSTRNM
ncbi:hypothetical protein SAY87_029357 [Trapa incisa]|uniref:t-SNARE coiled-coil homology domain-containing protein n=1 Tax=Trapa incisa TaxID=236973 RepID=A0AAN7K4B8_9MYRT|nr:hypothetical protein SAY87_029357 [Trapa incisa]